MNRHLSWSTWSGSIVMKHGGEDSGLMSEGCGFFLRFDLFCKTKTLGVNRVIILHVRS